MKYSIVIPTYNNKVLLRNTLTALNNQEGFGYKDYEVVVVDDGSTDNTGQYIKGVNKNYELKYFYLKRCKDSCRSRTRNYGWKNSRGKIISFIDSDILVNINYLSELERCFSMSNDILVIGNRIMLDKTTNVKDIKSKKVFKDYSFDKNNLNILEYRYFLYETASYNANAIMCPWMQIYSCNMAVSKKWLEKIGGFDENFKKWGMEDLELGFALYDKGIQIIINSKLEVLHQYHGTRNDMIVEKSKIPGYEINIDYFLNKHPHALRMGKKIAYKFFKGEISSDKLLMDNEWKKIVIDFKDKNKLDELKNSIKKIIKMDKIKPVINDYVEDTDLDIWINLLGVTKSVVKYYPMTKRLKTKEMINYLKVEKERQKCLN